MKKYLLLLTLLTLPLAARSTRTTSRAQKSILALRSTPHSLPGTQDEERDAILNSVQQALYDADAALDNKLSPRLTILLHKQLSFYQKLTPQRLASIDRVDAKNLQTELDAITNDLTAEVAQQAGQGVDIQTLAHIRIANSYLHTVLSPRHFRKASGWKRFTRGGGGSSTILAPVLAGAGVVLTTAACFLYTFKDRSGKDHYLLRRSDLSRIESTRQSLALSEATRAVDAVIGYDEIDSHLVRTQRKYMDDKANKLLASIVTQAHLDDSTDVVTVAQTILQSHLNRLALCLRADQQVEIDAESAEKERQRIAIETQEAERAGSGHMMDDPDRLRSFTAQVTIFQEQLNKLTDTTTDLSSLEQSIGHVHTWSILRSGLKHTEYTDVKINRFGQVIKILCSAYRREIDDLPVRASSMYNTMLYRLIVGTRTFKGYAEQAAEHLAALPEGAITFSDGIYKEHIEAAQEYATARYDANNTAVNETALFNLFQFVTKKRFEIVRIVPNPLVSLRR